VSADAEVTPALPLCGSLYFPNGFRLDETSWRGLRQAQGPPMTQFAIDVPSPQRRVWVTLSHRIVPAKPR